MQHRALMIIPAAYFRAANTDAAAYSGNPEDARTFRAGLSPLGKEPPTHYWCSLVCSSKTWQALTTVYSKKYPLAHIEDWAENDDGRPKALLTELGLSPLLGGPL